MPTADSYNYFCSLNTTTGLGAGGNGLPLFSDAVTARKLDVSSYAHVQALTIQKVAPIYWNCYKVLCDCDIGEADIGHSGENVEACSVSEAEYDSSDAGYQPKNRRTNVTPSSVTNSDTDSLGFSNNTASLGLAYLTDSLRFLYNGSTSDSSKFIGYGFLNLIVAKVNFIASYFPGSESRITQKTISSIFQSEQSNDAANDITYNYSTVSISGVNFKQELKVQDFYNRDGGSIDAADPTRSVGNITLDFFTY